MDAISTAMEQLSMIEQTRDLDIDSMLQQDRSHKPLRTTSEDRKTQLYKDFLTPSQHFSTLWLDRLQARWPISPSPTALCSMADTMTRTVIRFDRHGLGGRVTGYNEVTVTAASGTAKSSRSLLRKPASRADYVRGSAGSLPFAANGTEVVETAAELDDEVLTNAEVTQSSRQGLDRIINFSTGSGMLAVAPGLSRGLKPRAVEKQIAEDIDTILEQPGYQAHPTHKVADLHEVDGGVHVNQRRADQEEAHVGPNGAGLVTGEGEDEKTVDGDGVDSEHEEEDLELDDLLPVEYPALLPRSSLMAAREQRVGKDWSHVVNLEEPLNLAELVPDMAIQWPFKLDSWQKHAIWHLENGDDLFVSVPTSAGKTTIAQYAMSLAAKHMTKAIYTSPIKALSNQKFRDFTNDFDSVGLLTGDTQINSSADLLVMTTEILRSMLYRGADLIRDLEFVILDEVHWLNDPERGVIYEETLMLLPSYVSVIMLSATVSQQSVRRLASWIGEMRKKDIYIVSTNKRPVPLEFFLWADKRLFKIVDASGTFSEKGVKDATDAMTGRDKIAAAEQKAKEKEEAAVAAGHAGRGRVAQARAGQQRRGDSQHQGRGGQQRGGRAMHRGTQQRGRGNVAHNGRSGPWTTASQDRNIWVHLTGHLRAQNLLPCAAFAFSKKKCEENADSLSRQDFLDAKQKHLTHMIWEKSIARLRPEDRQLPQILRLRELSSRGIGIHHSGIITVAKEVIEILLIKSLIQIAFCTESLGAGLHMPVRTVILSGLRKHDRKSLRYLDPAEAQQLAGRAGRRGLDGAGTVIIIPSDDEPPTSALLKHLILGQPAQLQSKWRLTYAMILSVLRIETWKLEEFIRKSFSSSPAQLVRLAQERQIQVSEDALANMRREKCDICDPDIDRCHDASVEYERLTQELQLETLRSSNARSWQAKRLIVFRGRDNVRTAGILLRDGLSKRDGTSIQVLEMQQANRKQDDTDFFPYLPNFRPLFPPLPRREGDIQLQTQTISTSDIEAITVTQFKEIDLDAVTSNNKDEIDKLKVGFLDVCTAWTAPALDEVDYYSLRKEIQFRVILDERTQAANTAQQSKTTLCPSFKQHFAAIHNEWALKDKITSTRAMITDQALTIQPDYQARIDVLRELSYVDNELRVQLKGKVACEIRSASELVLTELILSNTFANYEADEVVALLSCFVFEERTTAFSIDSLTPSLKAGIEDIIRVTQVVNDIQTRHQVILASGSDEAGESATEPRFGLVEVIYEWSRGMSFKNITELTDVLEGTIVRTVSRLDAVCREVISAARVIGDENLHKKMLLGLESIKRDICNTASLYM